MHSWWKNNLFHQQDPTSWQSSLSGSWSNCVGGFTSSIVIVWWNGSQLLIGPEAPSTFQEKNMDYVTLGCLKSDIDTAETESAELQLTILIMLHLEGWKMILTLLKLSLLSRYLTIIQRRHQLFKKKGWTMLIRPSKKNSCGAKTTICDMYLKKKQGSMKIKRPKCLQVKEIKASHQF